MASVHVERLDHLGLIAWMIKDLGLIRMIDARLGPDEQEEITPGEAVAGMILQAYASGSLRLVTRIHALLAIAEGMAVSEGAQMLTLGEQTVRDYLNRFLWRGVGSLAYQRPPGRPSTLTKTQRQELTALITAGPQASGYASGCWSATMLQDLIQRHFGVEYHPHYICTLLDNLRFSYQKARFVSAHLDEATRT